MVNYPNYRVSIDTTEGVVFPEIIPATAFEVSSAAKVKDINRTSGVTAAVALFILTVGISIMCSSSIGNDMFWVGTADSLLGLSLAVTAGVYHHLLHRALPKQMNQHQNRALHRCKNAKDYLSHLENDKNVNYTFRLPGYVEERSKENLEKLQKQTTTDTGRQRFFRNGIEYKGDPNNILLVADNPQLIHGLFNQSTIESINNVIKSRYQLGQGLDVVAAPCGFHPKDTSLRASFMYLILDESKKPIALEVRTLYELKCKREGKDEMQPIGAYLMPKMVIDFKTGDAVISWSSPQSEEPKGF
jgi:hypothetical protein